MSGFVVLSKLYVRWFPAVALEPKQLHRMLYQALGSVGDKYHRAKTPPFSTFIHGPGAAEVGVWGECAQVLCSRVAQGRFDIPAVGKVTTTMEVLSLTGTPAFQVEPATRACIHLLSPLGFRGGSRWLPVFDINLFWRNLADRWEEIGAGTVGGTDDLPAIARDAVIADLTMGTEVVQCAVRSKVHDFIAPDAAKQSQPAEEFYTPARGIEGTVWIDFSRIKNPLSLSWLYRLLRLAEYTGVGAKRAQGMGCVSLRFTNDMSSQSWPLWRVTDRVGTCRKARAESLEVLLSLLGGHQTASDGIAAIEKQHPSYERIWLPVQWRSASQAGFWLQPA